jgi:osmoprotectant transport system permease protein
MRVKKAKIKDFIKLIVLVAVLVIIVFVNDFVILKSSSFTYLKDHIYTRTDMATLLLNHLCMVCISTSLAVILGVSIGIFVTRKAGRDFLYTVNSIVSLGQTFPPIAVLAISVPMVGFGFKPTIIALFLYGLLPIVRNTIAGLESISPAITDTAKGIGMTNIQTLFKVELPLALNVIISGIRTTTIINIGTATLGATIGAGGLGSPIIEGMGRNPVYVIEGAIVVGILALVIDSGFDIIELLTASNKRKLGVE